MTRLATFCAAALAISVLAGCGGKEDRMTTETTETPGTAQTPGAVCDLVDPALVAEVVGDGDVRTTGPGAVSRETRRTGVSHCSITAADAREPVIQVRLGDVGGDVERWRTTLKDEAEKAGVTLAYEDAAWYGYTRNHTSGMYNPGSSLNVVTDEHVLRVTVYKWSGSTHKARVDVAERIARSAAANQTTFDQKG